MNSRRSTAAGSRRGSAACRRRRRSRPALSYRCAARRIATYLKQEARRDLEAASRRYAQEIGVRIKRITVRDQSSRWGSCSTTGALSYSWRLIFAPPYVLDYLAAHEVAHLVEMNHSTRFWRLLAQLSPAMKRAKTWLDVHGTDLHR